MDIVVKNAQFSDQAYVDGLKNRDNRITRSFFYEECRYLLNDIRYSLFSGQIPYEELVSELYVELNRNNWQKLDSFAGLNGCQLRTWLSTVAWRFFFKIRMNMRERAILEDSVEVCRDTYDSSLDMEIRMDIRMVLKLMKNQRYAEALEFLLLKDCTLEEVAALWNTSVVNVYNIKHRALLQFISIYGGERKKSKK